MLFHDQDAPIFSSLGVIAFLNFINSSLVYSKRPAETGFQRLSLWTCECIIVGSAFCSIPPQLISKSETRLLSTFITSWLTLWTVPLLWQEKQWFSDTFIRFALRSAILCSWNDIPHHWHAFVQLEKEWIPQRVTDLVWESKCEKTFLCFRTNRNSCEWRDSSFTREECLVEDKNL